MRCKNCGWPNRPNETKCVKCGSPLEAESDSPGIPDGGFEVQGHGYRPQGDGNGLKKTVSEAEIFGSQAGGGISEYDQRNSPTDDVNCPRCGYPVRPETIKCPNCGYILNVQQGQPHTSGPAKQNSPIVSSGYQRRPTRVEDDIDTDDYRDSRKTKEDLQPTRKIQSKTRPIKGTVNPYMMDFQSDPVFVLTPVKRINERKPTNPVELEGSEVILTRENTEPGNSSITSGDQAVVTCSDGHWYIEDLSEQKTTFVQANRKIELHDGDIILLGNRLFEFREQE